MRLPRTIDGEVTPAQVRRIFDGAWVPIGPFQDFSYRGCDDLMILAKMTPTGPQSCRFTAHYLMERGADPQRVDDWIGIWNQTYDEDAAAVEVQQGNLVSGRAREFRFVSNREEPALFINRLIWEAYKAHLSGGDGSDQPLQAAE